MATETAIGAHLTLTSTRTLFWDLSTDVEVTGTPKVAVTALGEEPDSLTAWTNAAWTAPEVVTGTVHTRRLQALVAGPNGPTAGSPLVIPAAGEYATWVRYDTASERIEVPAQLVSVG